VDEPALSGSDGFQGELEHFLRCCSENRAPTLCPPEESAAAVKLARLMLEARNRKGEMIPCRL
jgi:hypothetical protein